MNARGNAAHEGGRPVVNQELRGIWAGLVVTACPSLDALSMQMTDSCLIHLLKWPQMHMLKQYTQVSKLQML